MSSSESVLSVTKEPLAHLSVDGRPHLLEEHLKEVAKQSQRFGKILKIPEWAFLAGLWHDLGKYAANFQVMIRKANGFDAHIEGDVSGPRDHSSAGAIHAIKTFQKFGVPLAFVIAGHHAGLANFQDLHARLKRKEERYQSALKGGVPASILRVVTPPVFPEKFQKNSPETKRRFEMWIRMLFSALCDADFLDTETFYDPSRTALRKRFSSLETLHHSLIEFLKTLQKKAEVSSVNQIRAEVLRASIESASNTPGFFSLHVPTGGGKTLSSMAFALEHARKHDLERIVVAIPFTSIIEQNATVYREAMAKKAILEHHSALEPTKDTPENRISCENWDAPIIVTTTVQLFESLFSRRSSSCRKLHRLARSVIILDEAQTLPPGLLHPILDALQTLVEDFESSVVISTATQPVFSRSKIVSQGLENVREIIPDPQKLSSQLRRVKTKWPSFLEAISYETLAREVAQEENVLVIVHQRKDARDLCLLLDQYLGHQETLHLSALLCPEHRTKILKTIQERKSRGEPVRLVSTQLVEAGVDLDFPVVYRALAGIDALTQAAGRCNREGKQKDLGELRVFVAPTKPPPGVLRTALSITKGMLRANPTLDIFSPDVITEFFQRLYFNQNLDAEEIQSERESLNFQTVAERFKLIEDGWSAPILVPYPDKEAHKKRISQLEQFGPSQDRLRQLQRFLVNVPRTLREEWILRSYGKTIEDIIVVLEPSFSLAYDARFGLEIDKVGVANPDELVW